MPTVIPTQEVAYSQPTCTLSTINDLFVQVTYTEYYNYNVDALSYSGYSIKNVCIPVATIAVVTEVNNDENGNELSCSLVIKNGNATVISINNNNINVDTGDVYTQTDFNNIYDNIYSASLA